MAIVTGAFSEALWPGIMKWFGDTYTEWEPIWEKLVSKHDSDKQFEKFQGVTEYGLAGIKDQGNGIPYRDKFQGFPREILNIFYGIGSTITYEMMRYDQYNLMEKIPQQLARSVRRTEETVVHSVLNNGFSTSATPALTADGLSLFNSAHLLVAAVGTTQRNTPATAADLSQTALEQADIDISNFVDDQNLPIVVRATKLVVPTANKLIARKILETEYEVGSGNNTVNVVSNARANSPLELVWSPYLTDSDSWYLRTDVEDGIAFTEVDAVMIDRDNDFDTKNLKFSAMRGFGVAPVNYLGWYASPGA